MSTSFTEAAVREAATGATSQKQILDRLGVTAATSNYERLREAARTGRISIPASRPTGSSGPRARSGALADDARLHRLHAEGMSTFDMLETVGLRPSSSNRWRLDARLGELGLVPNSSPFHAPGRPTENLERLLDVELDAADIAKHRPNSSGDAAELLAAACLRRAGAIVSATFGSSSRYDLVVDIGSRLFRVQVKSASIRKGAVVVPTMSARSKIAYAANEVDAIVAYVAAVNSVFWFPMAEIDQAREFSVRLDEPRNGQRSRTRSAMSYFIGHP